MKVDFLHGLLGNTEGMFPEYSGSNADHVSLNQCPCWGKKHSLGVTAAQIERQHREVSLHSEVQSLHYACCLAAQ